VKGKRIKAKGRRGNKKHASLQSKGLTQPSPKERALKTFLSLPRERFKGGLCSSQ
jgi:hypothetical protein